MTPTLDADSMLVHATGETTLRAVEATLAISRLTLDVVGAGESDATVAGWLASGAPGARDAWLDPADHVLAGLELRLRDGRTVVVRPAPRRAVGPDLVALVVGMRERFGAVEGAWLRVHRVGVPRPTVGELRVEKDPELSHEELHLLEAIGAQLARRGPT